MLLNSTDFAMKLRRTDTFLVIMTAALVGLTVMLAVTVLWLVNRVQQETSRIAATRTVVSQGGQIAAVLAGHPAVTNVEAAGEEGLTRLVDGMHAAEDSIEYVSVTRGGVTVFHRPTTPIDATAPDSLENREAIGRTGVILRRISVRGKPVPVVVFTRDVPSPDGTPFTVEVALRHEAVDSRQAATSTAVTAMFRVALATVVTALLGCMAIVALLIRREWRRQEQRRREEHLAFSGVLANGIAHDFRNPMSSLRLDVQMLEREVGNESGMRRERVSSLASRIRGTLDRMDKVFQEFLYLSRPEDSRREPVDLRTLVRECLDIMAPRFEHTGITPATDLPAVPVPVAVHPSSFKRALVNVLANAEQFAGPAGSLRVAAVVTGNSVRLDVCDSGPGIPPSDRKRVFDMFYTTRPEGTGLGLYLARSAVERSGGAIEALEAPGGGTCIRITLPLASSGPTSAPENGERFSEPDTGRSP